MAKAKGGFKTVGLTGSGKKLGKNQRSRGQAVDVKHQMRGFNSQLAALSGISNG